MNYIKQLQEDKKELQNKLNEVSDELMNIRIYLSSSKFQGVDNDYVHVSTDIRPKIETVIGLIYKI